MKKKIYQRLWFWIIIVGIVLVVIGLFNVKIEWKVKKDNKNVTLLDINTTEFREEKLNVLGCDIADECKSDYDCKNDKWCIKKNGKKGCYFIKCEIDDDCPQTISISRCLGYPNDIFNCGWRYCTRQ